MPTTSRHVRRRNIVASWIAAGKEYEYVYDPFGRLRKIKNTSNQALVAEYWYNGLGHRITWHSDTSRSGGGAPDGTVDTNDPKVHFIYNERWQQVATYRQANGSSIDTHPKEQFVNHAAGLAGYGSSSYIDGVILRDDHEDDWTEAADSTMERRVYYCQNWRADVVALVAENGRVLERAWYEPYGTPHGMSPADFSGTSDDTNDHYLVPDGDADADDSFVYLDLFGLSAGLSDVTGSSDPGDGEYGRPNGTVDSDDYFYYLDQYSVAAALGRNVLSAGHDGATASHGAGNLRNRKGLAGYEWDPHVRRYHVRNRVQYPETGRWTRRDPLGYVDGMGLYVLTRSAPHLLLDGFGEDSAVCTGLSCTRMPAFPPDAGALSNPIRAIGIGYIGAAGCPDGGHGTQGVYRGTGCDAVCTTACNMNQFLGGVPGITLCDGPNRVSCFCRTNAQKGYGLTGRDGTYILDQFAKCVEAHEATHVRDISCAANPPGTTLVPPDLPWKTPVCGGVCSEYDAYNQSLACAMGLSCQAAQDPFICERYKAVLIAQQQQGVKKYGPECWGCQFLRDLPSLIAPWL